MFAYTDEVMTLINHHTNEQKQEIYITVIQRHDNIKSTHRILQLCCVFEWNTQGYFKWSIAEVVSF